MSKKMSGLRMLPSNDADIMEIPIAWLFRDRELQPRKGIKGSKVKEYAAAYRRGADMPPITVVKDGEVYILADGWHRVAALESNGKSEVNARILIGDQNTVRVIAATANLGVGLALKRVEFWNGFGLYVKAGGLLKATGAPKTFEEIAVEFCGQRDASTFWRYMKKKFPKVLERYYSRSTPGGVGGSQINYKLLTRHESYKTKVENALQEALAASKGVTDREERWQLMEMTKRVAVEIEKGGPWKEPELGDF